MIESDTILRQIDELKARLASARPLPKEALSKIEETIAIEYTYESNRIEGNTLTLQETALVIEEGLTIGGKSLREHLEAINHNEAIAFIKDIAAYLHDELVRIHPFIDGNGRTSRLLMNLYLLRHGYVMVLLKGDAESKLAYYKALEISHVDKDETSFRQLVEQAELDALQRYIDIIET